MLLRKDYYNREEAAAAIGVHPDTIRRLVSLGKLQPHIMERKMYFRKEDIHAVGQEEYPAGLSYVEIARRYGVAVNTVKHRFSALGVQPIGRHRHHSYVYDVATVDSVALSLGWLRSQIGESSDLVHAAPKAVAPS